jgi:hypothetical protein
VSLEIHLTVCIQQIGAFSGISVGSFYSEIRKMLEDSTQGRFLLLSHAFYSKYINRENTIQLCLGLRGLTDYVRKQKDICILPALNSPMPFP